MSRPSAGRASTRIDALGPLGPTASRMRCRKEAARASPSDRISAQSSSIAWRSAPYGATPSGSKPPAQKYPRPRALAARSSFTSRVLPAPEGPDTTTSAEAPWLARPARPAAASRISRSAARP